MKLVGDMKFSCVTTLHFSFFYFFQEQFLSVPELSSSVPEKEYVVFLSSVFLINFDYSNNNYKNNCR